ncbi:hypothetical protein RTBOTA2_005304 [Rhodotorula toruloides]|uniref:Uncharacterized protein n=1 Tax=Rhodotorula toruloides TaxID=5286 RepID=A0A0K3CF67_RHOTO|nr:hypothetical protein RTBOTA2_005304 [Rhodotorula toruloides]PRQ74125.1 hypothetical protein AAT19DRAFT_14478 [Rhodotorula toruloides]
MSTVPLDYAQGILTALVREVPYLETWRASLDDQEVQWALERVGREGIRAFIISLALLKIAGSPSSRAKRGEPVLPNTSELVAAIEARRVLTFNLPAELVKHATQTIQHRIHTQVRKSNAANASALWALSNAATNPELWRLSEAAEAKEQHSLLKPTIGRRVARLHGTTKEEWERRARAF